MLGVTRCIAVLVRCERVYERAVFIVVARRVERDCQVTHLEYFLGFLLVHAQLFSELRSIGLHPCLGLFNCPLSVDLIHLVLHVGWQADQATRIADVAPNRLRDPVKAVGAETIALRELKLFSRSY